MKITIDDAGAYVRPFTLTFMARLNPGEEIMEYICQENNQFGIAGGTTSRRRPPGSNRHER